MSLRWLAWVILPFGMLAARAEDPSKDLAPPVKINAGGKAIEAPSPVAPFYGDFKGDGVQSLLVGGGDGKLRVYRNQATGTGNEHRFDNFTTFLEGKAGGGVPGSGDAGFTPLLATQGQTTDLFSGSSTGELFIFRSKGKGTYAAGEHLKDKDGKTIHIAGASTVFPFDWRGTGKRDLIVGAIDGCVYLVPNDGKESQDSYGRPKKMEVDGKAIKVPLGHSHPVVADWDKDGKPDLIVGTGAGSVLWYRNITTGGEPRLAAAQTLVHESLLASNKDAVLKDGQWGLLARVCVVDWNGDGRLDLLVGDTVAFKPPLTDAEKAAEKKARADYARAEKDYNAAMQKYRALEKPPAKETAKALAQREKEMQELKTSTAKYQKEMQDLEKQIAREQQPVLYHGHIWLFLRKASGTASKDS